MKVLLGVKPVICKEPLLPPQVVGFVGTIDPITGIGLTTIVILELVRYPCE
jgi:hypothetical protein